MTSHDRPNSRTVELKETPVLTVAAVKGTGPFEEIGSVLTDLFRWVLSGGGKVASYPMALFPDLPGEPGSGEGRFEVCVPIEEDARIQGGQDVTISKLPAVQVAFARHYGNPERIDGTYDLIRSWIAENGLNASAPYREIYLTNPMETDEADRVTEVQIPVGRSGGMVH